MQQKMLIMIFNHIGHVLTSYTQVLLTSHACEKYIRNVFIFKFSQRLFACDILTGF